MPEIEPAEPSIKQLKGLHLWHAPMSSCSQRVRIVLAETDKSYESHLIDLEKDEHASSTYQAIHPKGLVPAFVEDGHLYIESVDIISHIAADYPHLNNTQAPELLKMADEAQLDLKLLTFEFLFRSGKSAEPEEAEAFQASHNNDWLKQFRKDFAAGFDPRRLDDAVTRIDAGFQHLENVLADGRTYLGGEEFSVSDVAWMPNVHRFKLMDWPFERTPKLQDWFVKVSARNSYEKGLLQWQPEPVQGHFADYTKRRREAGTDVRQFGSLATG